MAELDFTIQGAVGEIAAATFRDAIGNAVGLLREFDSAISGRALGSLRWYVSKLHSNGSLTIGFASKVKVLARKTEHPTDYSPVITGTFMAGLDALETKGLLPPYLSEQGLQKAEVLSGLIGRNGASGFQACLCPFGGSSVRRRSRGGYYGPTKHRQSQRRGTIMADLKVKSQAKPITISPALAARCDGNDQAERMDKVFRAVLSVPHSAVVKDAEKRRRERMKKKSL